MADARAAAVSAANAAAAARKERIAAMRAARGSGRRLNSSEDEVSLDPTKSAAENVSDALSQIVTQSGVTKTKKLAYLNALVQMWEQKELEQDQEGNIRLREVMLCLRIPLTHESAEVRAATLRTLRRIINTEQDVALVTTLNLHYLITRCIDIELDNKIERIQALRLARKLNFVAPMQLPQCIVRSLISIADGDYKENDRLKNVCLAILAELSVSNNSLFISCNGVSVLTHNLLDSTMPKIAEAMLGALLRLYNDPEVRAVTDIRLDAIVAPFTEFRYIHDDTPAAPTGAMSASEAAELDRQFRFACAQQVTLSALRSWPGLLHMADEASRRGISPLQSIVDILYLERKEVRNLVINLFFETLCLRLPQQCESYADALRTIDPSYFREQWKLAEGFVASEGFDILPHLAKSRPNLIECHRSVLLIFLLNAKLPEALVNVIVSSTDAEVSIKATMLLGEFLYAANVLLPREHNAAGHCLPTLLSEVSSSDVLRSNRAAEAVTALQKLHTLKKRQPTPNSLFLEHIMSFSDGSAYRGSLFGDGRLPSNSPVGISTALASSSRSSDEKTQNSIAESKVLTSKDAVHWQWPLVAAVLKWPGEALPKSLESGTNKQFFKKLLDFYKPTNALFSRLDLGGKKARMLAKIGCHLCDFLVKAGTSESMRLLEDFLTDIKNQLSLVLSTRDAASLDCLFSPTKLATTASQYYFLFLGGLSRTPEGRKALDNLQILQSMYELLSMRSDMYLKLVISCLDYSCVEWGSRNVLGKALKESSPLCRLYATKFLGVLIRSKIQTVTQWGIEMLVQQLFDDSKIVPWSALDILDEACDDKMYLEALICALAQKKDLAGELGHLGMKGSLLLTRLLTSQNGFRHLLRANFLTSQLALWAETHNVSYVSQVEDALNDGFTHHQKNEERTYGRRSYDSHSLRDVFVPPHLYGQLATSKEGLELLIQEDALAKMFQLLKEVKNASNVSDVSKVKAAIWAVCHIAATPEGVLLAERERAIDAIVSIAENSGLLSLRGTALYALSLVATTRLGVKLLERVEWCSVKHSREEKWPVLEECFREQLADLDLLDASLRREMEERRNEEEEQGESLVFESTPIVVVPPTVEFPSRSSVSEERSASSIGEHSIGKEGSSLSGRKRLSKMFRSFSLGKERHSAGGTPSKSPEEGSAGGKRLSARLKRRLFQNASFSQDNSGIEKDSEFQFDPSENLNLTAPIATPEDVHTPSTASKSNPCPEKEIEVIEPETSGTSYPNPIKERERSHTRSGQRALSESEAQNVTNVTVGSSEEGRHLLDPNIHQQSFNSISSLGSMTLRSIHQRRRPNANESTTEGGEASAPTQGELISAPSMLPSLLQRSDTWSRKSRSLDYKLLRMRPRFSTLPSADAARLQSKHGRPMLPLPEEATEGKEPKYMGIALPYKIERLFPIPSNKPEVISEIHSDYERTSSGGDAEDLIVVPSMVTDWLETHHSDLSQGDQDRNNVASFHGLDMHTNSNCLGCYKLLRNDRSRRRAESLTIPEHIATTSSGAATLSNHGSPQMRIRHGKDSDHAPGISALALGSGESLLSCRSEPEAHAGSNRGRDGAMGKVMQRKEVLQIISILSASIGSKTAEQGLLKLKQRYPDVFTDLCLYSEVCLLMTKYSFRLSSRRFIQELFMDVDFECLYEEPYQILRLEESPAHQQQLSQLAEIASDENIVGLK